MLVVWPPSLRTKIWKEVIIQLFYVSGLYSMSLYVMRLIVSTPPLDIEPVGALLCYTYLTFDHLMTHVSIINIIAIGVDRYLSIEDPMRYRAKRTGLQVKKIICSIWLACFFLWFLIVFLWPLSVVGIRSDDEYCTPYYESTPLGSILAALIYFWVPTPILFALYLKLYATTARMKQSMQSNVVMTDIPQKQKEALAHIHEDAAIVENYQPSTDDTGKKSNSLFVLANETAAAQEDITPNSDCNFLSRDIALQKKNRDSIKIETTPQVHSVGPYDDRKKDRKGIPQRSPSKSASIASVKKISSMIETVASMAEAQNTKAFKAFSFILGEWI